MNQDRGFRESKTKKVKTISNFSLVILCPEIFLKLISKILNRKAFTLNHGNPISVDHKTNNNNIYLRFKDPWFPPYLLCDPKIKTDDQALKLQIPNMKIPFFQHIS